MLQHSSRLAANTPIKYPNRNRAALCYQGNKATLKKQAHRHQQSLQDREPVQDREQSKNKLNHTVICATQPDAHDNNVHYCSCHC